MLGSKNCKMKIILLLITICIAGFVEGFEIACDRKELQRCVDLIEGMQLSKYHMFGVPNDEMENICSKINEGERCMHDIVEPCLSEEGRSCFQSKNHVTCAHGGDCTKWKLEPCGVKDTNQCDNGTFLNCRVSANSRCAEGRVLINITDIDITDELYIYQDSVDRLESIHDIKQGFCIDGGDSLMKKVDPAYLEHKHCLGVHHNVLAECRLRLSAAGPHGNYSTNVTEFEHDCCSFYQSQDCVVKEYSKFCGSSAGDFVKHLLRKSSDHRTMCECKIFEDSDICSSSASFALSSTLFIFSLFLLFGKFL